MGEEEEEKGRRGIFRDFLVVATAKADPRQRCATLSVARGICTTVYVRGVTDAPQDECLMTPDGRASSSSLVFP